MTATGPRPVQSRIPSTRADRVAPGGIPDDDDAECNVIAAAGYGRRSERRDGNNNPRRCARTIAIAAAKRPERRGFTVETSAPYTSRFLVPTARPVGARIKRRPPRVRPTGSVRTRPLSGPRASLLPPARRVLATLRPFVFFKRTLKIHTLTFSSVRAALRHVDKRLRTAAVSDDLFFRPVTRPRPFIVRVGKNARDVVFFICLFFFFMAIFQI